MKISLTELPSAAQIIGQIVEDLTLGRSVLFIPPATQSLDIPLQAITNGVERNDLWLEHIKLTNLPDTYEGG